MINKKQIKGWIRFFYNLDKNYEQEQIILNYCNRHNLALDNKNPWIVKEFTLVDYKHDFKQTEGKLEELERGDLIIVSELANLSRSITNLSEVIELLCKKEIELIAIKDQIRFSVEDQQLMSTFKFFSYLKELLRKLDNKRCNERYDRENFKPDFVGKRFDENRSGRLAKTSIFEPYREKIIKLLQEDCSYHKISKAIGMGSIGGLKRFIESRNLREKTLSENDSKIPLF